MANGTQGYAKAFAPTKTDRAKNKLKQDKRQHTSMVFPENLETVGTKNIFLLQVNAIQGSKYNGQQYQTVEGGEGQVVYQSGDSGSLARKFTGNYIRTATSIALHMPESVQASYKADWGSTDLGVTGSVLDAWAGSGDLTNVSTWQGIYDKQMQESAGEVASMMGIRALNAVTPFAVKDAYQFSKATVENPYTEVLFKRVDNRTFEYEFKLIPRSKEEQATIKQIVDTLKFHQAPEKKFVNSNIYWSYPSTFDISFLKKDGHVNEWLFKHSTCALTGLTVKQGGDGFYSSYQDGSPFFTTIGMSFTELEVLDKERILDGY